MLTKCLVIVAVLLAGPALAQGWPNTQGPSTAGPGGWHPQPVPYPSFPTYQPQPQMPQTWTGMNLGNGLSTWNGSNGGTVNCQHIGITITCN